MKIERNPDGTPTDKYFQLAAIKILLGTMLTAHRDVLDAKDAARVLVSLAGDCAAIASGSSAIELGKLTAQLKDEFNAQALAAFGTFSELGLN